MNRLDEWGIKKNKRENNFNKTNSKGGYSGEVRKCKNKKILPLVQRLRSVGWSNRNWEQDTGLNLWDTDIKWWGSSEERKYFRKLLLQSKCLNNLRNVYSK